MLKLCYSPRIIILLFITVLHFIHSFKLCIVNSAIDVPPVINGVDLFVQLNVEERVDELLVNIFVFQHDALGINAHDEGEQD